MCENYFSVLLDTHRKDNAAAKTMSERDAERESKRKREIKVHICKVLISASQHKMKSTNVTAELFSNSFTFLFPADPSSLFFLLLCHYYV